MSRLCSKYRFSAGFHRSFINIRQFNMSITATSYIKEHVIPITITFKIMELPACINTIPTWWALWSCGNRCESSFLACETCFFYVRLLEFLPAFWEHLILFVQDLLKWTSRPLRAASHLWNTPSSDLCFTFSLLSDEVYRLKVKLLHYKCIYITLV